MKTLATAALAKTLAFPPIASYIINSTRTNPDRVYGHLHGYMHRWWVMGGYPLDANHEDEPRGIHALLHHILRADDDRHLHDHPRNARVFILKGWYVEERGDGKEYLRQAGDTFQIRHGEYHRITKVSPGGVWTIFMVGEYKGPWGFDVPGHGKVVNREYSAFMRNQRERERLDRCANTLITQGFDAQGNQTLISTRTSFDTHRDHHIMTGALELSQAAELRNVHFAEHRLGGLIVRPASHVPVEGLAQKALLTVADMLDGEGVVSTETGNAVAGWMRAMATSSIEVRAQQLVNDAKMAGQWLQISLVSPEPLAMGHLDMVVEVRPVRLPQPEKEVAEV